MLTSLHHHLCSVPDIPYPIQGYRLLLPSFQVVGICLQPPSWTLHDVKNLIYIWIINWHFYLSHLTNCNFLLPVSLTSYSAGFSSSPSIHKLLFINIQTVTWQLIELLSSPGMMCVSTAGLGDLKAKGNFISNLNDLPHGKIILQKKRMQ